MPIQPRRTAAQTAQAEEFAEPSPRKPLVLLRDTERSLRLKTVETLAPLLPEPLAINLGEASILADDSLEELAAIDLEAIDDIALRGARIQMGLMFIGFGALAMAFLLLVLYALHPELSAMEQVKHYWYQYVWLVCFGIAGLFMVGREAMRPPQLPDEWFDESERG